MAKEYPNLKETAKEYWEDYTAALVSLSILFVFSGSGVVLILLQLYPSAVPLVTITVTSLIAHMSVLYVRDVWSGEYNPDQTKITSSRNLFAMMVVSITFAAVFISLGTAVGLVVTAVPIDIPYLAAAAAAYYPVLDLLGLRRDLCTPGAIILFGISMVLASILNVQQAVFDSFPVIGNRRRPQF